MGTFNEEVTEMFHNGCGVSACFCQIPFAPLRRISPVLAGLRVVVLRDVHLLPIIQQSATGDSCCMKKRLPHAAAFL